jgi:diadenosine tetraphosphatase ApaH/serine/threonine PP2A family protein phosphatase
MYAGDPSRTAFMGHTHVPVVRDLPDRRLVNVGSVGIPLDGDPRACFVLATPADGRWQVETRRIAYDVEATIAAYDQELRAVDPGYLEIMSRELRVGQDYFGSWLRLSQSVPDEELAEALRRFLDELP